MTEPLLPEESIFAQALEVLESDRAAFLDRACAGDSKLRAEVESLLRADARTGDLLDLPHKTVASCADGPSETPGTVIGPYKLLEQIGEGGFGVVYMAEQERPVHRKVALKVLKPGMDTRQVIARFEAERQALALMDHPNIAHIHDGGTTATGRPYFVMELVRGVPITDYCDQNHLSVRERLELFIRVCQAVQHAHTKGVIHRDLKPSNVLVTLHDGVPVPKVIDFGIAKALGQRLTDKTLFTGFAQMIGTPLYMSPEQAELSGLDVDTRSDVYSLGVLLYELLTGTTPFDGDRMRKAGYDEMRRIIREEEPARPSSRISTLGQAASTLSTNRRSEPRRLRRLLRGELDWVVMKCLEKDRTRRYETVDALAKDVGRYLADEPVQACPPSTSYKVRKFVRRNKRGLATAAVVGITLLTAIGTVAGSIGWASRDRAARKADAEREMAERDAEFHRDVDKGLQLAAHFRDQDNWPDARAMVKTVASLLANRGRDDQRQQLAVVARDLEMVSRLDEIRLNLQIARRDLRLSLEAKEAYGAAFRDYGIDVLVLDHAVAGQSIHASAIRNHLVSALDDWTWINWYSSSSFNVRLVKGMALELKGRKRATLPRQPPSIEDGAAAAVARLADPDERRNRVRNLATLENRAALEDLAADPWTTSWRPATAILLARALMTHRATEKAMDVLFAAQKQSPNDLALNLELAESLEKRCKPPRLEEAIGFTRVALAARPQSSALLRWLGDLLLAVGRPDQAIAVYLPAAELDPKPGIDDFNRARCLHEKKEWSRAEAAYRLAIDHRYRVADCRRHLSWVYRNLGDWGRCADELRALHSQNPKDQFALVQLAWVLATDPDPRRWQIDQALALAREAVIQKPRDGFAWNALGVVCYRKGDWNGAIENLEKGRSFFQGGGAYEWFFLAMAYSRLGKEKDALRWYEQAVQWVKDSAEGLQDDLLMKSELLRFQAEAADLLQLPTPPDPTVKPGPAKKQ